MKQFSVNSREMIINNYIGVEIVEQDSASYAYLTGLSSRKTDLVLPGKFCSSLRMRRILQTTKLLILEKKLRSQQKAAFNANFICFAEIKRGVDTRNSVNALAYAIQKSFAQQIPYS